MTVDVASFVSENLHASVGQVISSVSQFARENKAITWTTCAGVAGYLVLKNPVVNRMKRDFADAYANEYLPGMDKMLHDFRKRVADDLDDYKKSNPNSGDRQLLEVGIGPGSSLEYYKDSE